MGIKVQGPFSLRSCVIASGRIVLSRFAWDLGCGAWPEQLCCSRAVSSLAAETVSILERRLETPVLGEAPAGPKLAAASREPLAREVQPAASREPLAREVQPAAPREPLAREVQPVAAAGERLAREVRLAAAAGDPLARGVRLTAEARGALRMLAATVTPASPIAPGASPGAIVIRTASLTRGIPASSATRNDRPHR